MRVTVSSRNKIFTLVSVSLLLFIVLFNALPGLTQGLDNIRLIRHFSSDESVVIGFFSEFYKGFAITPPTLVSYPTFFYYGVGTFLFPYSHFHPVSDNYKVIGITFRICNTLSIFATIILIYLLANHFLQSHIFSFIVSSLITLTPGYLYWGLNSRPHPFETLLLFLSISSALLYLEKRKSKYFYWCVIIAACAFATKFGGMFLIPAIMLVAAYFLSKNFSVLLAMQRKFSRVIVCFALLIAVFGIGAIAALYFFFLPLASQITQIGADLGVLGLANLKLVKAAVAGLALLLLCGIAWAELNFYCIKLVSAKKDSALTHKQKNLVLVNILLLLLCSISMLFVGMFCIGNPHYIVHPITAVRAFFGLGIIEFSFSEQGAGILQEWSNNLIWFKLLFNKHNLGLSGILLLLWYLFYEITNFKINWKRRNTIILQRIFLWLYIVTNFGFLLVFIKFRAPHYLSIISFLLFFLCVMGIKESLDFARVRERKNLLCVAFFCIVFLNVWERFPLFSHYYTFVNTKETDTGLAIGKWLEDNYKKDAIVWSDTKEFYIPMTFKNVHSKWWQEDIDDHLNSIKSINPDLIIISGVYEYDLVSAKKIIQAIQSGKLDNFILKKAFEYYGPLMLKKGRVGLYKSIYIFENKNLSNAIS